MANKPSKEFTKLEREWYQRLKNSGFRDIEDTNWESPSHRLLREWHSTLFCRAEKVAAKESREAYQAQIDYLLNHENFLEICALVTQFKSNRGKNVTAEQAARVWELHADGMTEYEIGRLLGINRNTIHSLLVRFTKWMIML